MNKNNLWNDLPESLIQSTPEPNFDIGFLQDCYALSEEAIENFKEEELLAA